MTHQEDKKISIVLISYNRCREVEEGLWQIRKILYPKIEVIVVDNASSDHTVEAIREHFPEVQVISLEKNIGIAAYNIGFQKAGGDFVVILDDDSFPEVHSLQRMVEEFEKNPNLAVVAFDVQNYEEFKKNTGTESATKPLKDRAVEFRYQLAFNGAGVGIRRKILLEMGGYASEFFLYWNEQDLSLKILDAGYEIKWFTDIIAYHKYSPINRESKRAPFFYTRNLFWLIWKHFPWPRMMKDTLFLIYNTIYYSFEQRTWIYSKAVLNALWNIRHIHRKPVKKEIIQQLRLTYKLPFVFF